MPLRKFVSRCAFAALGLFVFAPSLFADPVPSLDQLTVIDQGNHVTVIWHFYYKLLPSKPSLPPGNAQIVLDDPATLKQNLAALASSAFEITLDGQPAPPEKISELNVAPDGGCFATLLFPGHKNAHMELRETILPLYPASYVINYEIYSPLDKARGVSGYFMGGAASPAVEYVQIGGDIQPSIFDALSATPVKLFKAELRTPWINTNWLFLAILLLLARPAREIYPLALVMAAAWIVPTFFWTMDNLQIPVAIHPIVPAICTAAMCVFCVRMRAGFPLLASLVAGVGFLNGCYDVQQTSVERPAAEVVNLIGLSAGFVASLALIFTIAYVLIVECRKFPGFDRDWKPKICWALAALALVLAFVR